MDSSVLLTHVQPFKSSALHRSTMYPFFVSFHPTLSISTNIRASWFISTVFMYQSTSRPSRLPTFPPSATKTSTFSKAGLIFIYTILVDITFCIHWIERNLFVNSSRWSAFVAAGEANTGHLRKDSNIIHRSVREETGDGETVVRPPQQDLDAREEEQWRSLFAGHYAA
jgi:hypothetical protein